jgi:hypothetical protein
MSETITMTRSAFSKLLDVMYTPDPDDPYGPLGPLGRFDSSVSSSWLGLGALGRPRDDDPGPWGPIGPLIRTVKQIEHVLLNPQPLPPHELRQVHGLLNQVHWVLLNPQPLPPKWRQAEVRGPFPEPWRLAHVARALIEQAVAQHQLAQLLASDEGTERSVRRIGQQISRTVEEWCGTPPGPRWPFPWPPPFGELGAIDLLLAGMQFQRAADALGDHPLQRELGAAADHLMQTGLQRLDSGDDAPAHPSAPRLE